MKLFHVICFMKPNAMTMKLHVKLWLKCTNTICISACFGSHIFILTSRTHPFLMIMIMAPSSSIRTTSPPAHTPRMSPISSERWVTSRARWWSLQAAKEHTHTYITFEDTSNYLHTYKQAWINILTSKEIQNKYIQRKDIQMRPEGK